jgi:hypothetical protein
MANKGISSLTLLAPALFATVLAIGFPNVTMVQFFKEALYSVTVFGLVMMNFFVDPWVDAGHVGAPGKGSIGTEFIKKFLLCLVFVAFLVGLRVVSEGSYTIQGILGAGFQAMVGITILAVMGFVTILIMPNTSNSDFFIAGAVIGVVVLFLTGNWQDVFNWKLWVPAPVVDLFIWSLKMIARLFIQSGQEVVSIISSFA